MAAAAPGQIWRDDCYYLDAQTGECRRKYLLVLAVSPDGADAVTAVFTSRSHGLATDPACSVGPPRAGHFVGTPGGALGKSTWVDFSSLQTLDGQDLARHLRSGRKTLQALRLDDALFCAVLRCALQCDDLTGRQARWIGDAAAHLGCR